jgi:hypothetical protein
MTAADKLHLPPETARNKPDNRKRGGWTLTPKAINKVPRAGSKKIGGHKQLKLIDVLCFNVLILFSLRLLLFHH